MSTLAEITTAVERCIAEDYNFFISYYSKEYHITLSKRTYGNNSVELEVKGKGDTITDAFNHAFSNFPKSPLDGSQWQTNRLAAPDKVEDGQFNELNDDIPF